MGNLEVIRKRIAKMGTTHILGKIEKRAFTEEELPVVRELLEKRNYDVSDIAVFKTIAKKEEIKPSILDDEEEMFVPSISEDLVHRVEQAMDPIIEGNDVAKIRRIIPFIADKQYCELSEAEAHKIIAICNETEAEANVVAIVRTEMKKDKVVISPIKKSLQSTYVPKAGSNSEKILKYIIANPDMNMNQVAKHFDYRYPVVKRVNDMYVKSSNKGVVRLKQKDVTKDVSYTRN